MSFYFWGLQHIYAWVDHSNALSLQDAQMDNLLKTYSDQLRTLNCFRTSLAFWG